MDIILDNWLEIMSHLTFDLHSLTSTCKKIKYLYEKNKHLLCDIGNYRLTTTQKKISKNILDCHISEQLYIKNLYNRGNKLAIIDASIKYIGTTIIFTNKEKLLDWYRLVKILKLDNVIVLSKDTCDPRHISFLRKHHYNPIMLGYKIVIMTICLDTLYNINHSKLINHSNIYNNTNCVMINKMDYQLKNQINYENEMIPQIINKHYYCYRDETIGDVYLDSCNQDERCLSERLYDIYKLLPDESLLIKDFDDPVPKHIKNHMNYNYFFNHYLELKYKHIIFLWPAHQDIKKINQVCLHIEKISVPMIYIYNIHSTVEEKYMLNNNVLENFDFRFLKSPRKKLNYLQLIRTLLEKYNTKLDQLPNYYFELLLQVTNQDLNKLLEKIDQELK